MRNMNEEKMNISRLIFLSKYNQTMTPFCNATMVSIVRSSRKIIGRYCFPPLFFIGVIGNLLNLFVLNSRGMRTKTNIFLSAMAMSDLCFLICALPLEMITFGSFEYSNNYMSFYVNTIPTWMALVNWFSAASIWIAVLVTLERVVAIKAPLQAKLWWKSHKIAISLVAIYLFSFLASCYNFVWIYPDINHVCGNVYVYGLHTINATENPNLSAYVQFSLVVTPLLIVTIPTVFLVVLNSCLLYYLYRNQKSMVCQTNTPQQRQGNEFRVTCTVSIIVLSFIVFTSPSAVLIISQAVYKSRSKTYTEAVIFANLLVIVGKSVDFILYCLVSSHFRRRLMDLLCGKKTFFSRNFSSTSSNYERRRSTLTSLINYVDGHNLNTFLHYLHRKTLTNPARGRSASADVASTPREMNKLIDPLRKKHEVCYHFDRRMTHPIESHH